MCVGGPVHGSIRHIATDEFLVPVQTVVYITQSDWATAPDEIPYETHRYVWDEKQKQWIWKGLVLTLKAGLPTLVAAIVAFLNGYANGGWFLISVWFFLFFLAVTKEV